MGHVIFKYRVFTLQSVLTCFFSFLFFLTSSDTMKSMTWCFIYFFVSCYESVTSDSFFSQTTADRGCNKWNNKILRGNRLSCDLSHNYFSVFEAPDKVYEMLTFTSGRNFILIIVEREKKTVYYNNERIQISTFSEGF